MYRKDNFYLQFSNAIVTSKVNRYQTYVKSSKELITKQHKNKKNLSTCVTTQKVRLLQKTLHNLQFYFFQSFALGQGHPNNWHESEDLQSYYSGQFDSLREKATQTPIITHTHFYLGQKVTKTKLTQH